MKTLLINDYSHGGGAEVVFNKMTQLLEEVGHKVYTFIGAKDLKSNNRTPLSYLYNFKSAKNLENIFKKTTFDKVIVLNYASALSPSILRIIKKYKVKQKYSVIYNAHDEHLICPNSGLNYFMNGKMLRLPPHSSMWSFIFKQLDYRGHTFSLLKKIQWIFAYKILRLHKVFDLIITPSNFLKYRIELFYPKFESLVLRNPCLKEPNEDYQKKIEENRPLKMVFIGRLSQEKGIEQFVEGLKKVDFDYRFDIFGSGEREEHIQKIIESSSKISLKGQVSHEYLMTILSSYDVLVLPSLMFENAPMSIVEAAAHNLKILTMNYGGMKELAEYVGNSVCMEDYSKEEITNSLNTISSMAFSKANLAEFTENTYINNLLEILK